MSDFTIQLRTLSPLWTGGIDRTMDRLHETSIIGSLRWWYEALVRGLGGYACDPTGDDCCVYDEKEREKSVCAACYVFGCTGWARRFRLNAASKAQSSGEVKAGVDFELSFTELYRLSDNDIWLLTTAVSIAANYGAIGGKTPLKPQQKGGKVGGDYGLVAIRNQQSWQFTRTKPSGDYWSDFKRASNAQDAPDLRWFFFVKGAFLWRKQINQLIGLSEDGKQQISHQGYQNYLRGAKGVSKKVFSFQADGGRVWGYTKDRQMRNDVIGTLKVLLSNRGTCKTGEEVIHEL